MSVPSTAGFIGVDTSTSKSITMPATTERQGRVITFKDKTGNAGTCPIILNRANSDTFEDGTTQYLINTPYGSVTFISRGTTWYILNENQPTFLTLSTGNVIASSINLLDRTTGYDLNLLSVSSGTLLLNNNYIMSK